MSCESPLPRKTRLDEYVRIWAASIGRVLRGVSGAAHTALELPAEVLQKVLEALQTQGISAQFEAGQGLAGEQGFMLSKGDGVRLAQFLLTQPQDANVNMNDDHRNALSDVFRQFADAATASLKEMAGAEVNFKWLGFDRSHLEPAVRVGLELTSEKLPPFIMIFEISPTLATALGAMPPAPALPLTPPVDRPQALAPGRDPKLELLMDVELDATLRFGERQMTLRGILDLNAGSVVELDQNVRDPVELLVGGKVIAQGEVVIVDGNYGLRVTEIVSPMERIESLRN